MLQDELRTCGEAATVLKVKPSTIRAWTSRRRIPFVKLLGGRAVRYRQSDLEKIIKAGLRPALRPLVAPAEGEGVER